ncbi:MAG TPA: hypothetical protein VNH44_01610, partial [Micropepsaceae bacterium]|nr:hypothetical protein [Micropepsaceae bacterium]
SGNGGNGEGRGRKRRRRRRGGRGRGPHPSSLPENELEPRVGDGGPLPAIAEAGPDALTSGSDDEDDEADGGPEGGETGHGAPSGPTPVNAGETGEPRRRRRRRGRRGRRGPGEMGGAPGEHRAQDQAVAAAPGFTAPPSETTIIVPNADSSPLWSLSDQSADRGPTPEAPQTVIASVAAPEKAEVAMVSPEPPAAAPVVPMVEPQSAAPVTQTPEQEPPAAAELVARDARKGWWQRRFKM